jgi:hypothetical protein
MKQQTQIFIKNNSLTVFRRTKRLLYRIIFIGIMSISVLFGQSDLFSYGNNRPVADAGMDIKTQSKGSIFLDASRSFISNGSKLKYQWIFAPGLALNSENDFSSELSIETYGSKYLKSIETHKQVLDVKLAENVPGTKLEVILKVSDRIGFEDADTLIVEYFDPTAPSKIVVDTLDVNVDSLALILSDSDSVVVEEGGSGILIQGLTQGEIIPVDIQIINSIIMDQIQVLGFDYIVYLNKNLKPDELTKGYDFDCITDSCASNNARILDAAYVLSWGFPDAAADVFSIRIFEPENFSQWIDNEVVSNPYSIISKYGVYGLEPAIRASVSKILSDKRFRKQISTVNRFRMKNDRWIALGKYPLMVGAMYLLIDKVFLQDSVEPPEQPPGFPHDP